MDNDQRLKTQQAFERGTTRIVVATGNIVVVFVVVVGMMVWLFITM